MPYVNYGDILNAWDKGYDIVYKLSGVQYRLIHEGSYQIKYKKASEFTGEFVQHKTDKNLLNEYPYLESEISAALSEGTLEIPGFFETEFKSSYNNDGGFTPVTKTSSQNDYYERIDYARPEDFIEGNELPEEESPDLVRYELLYKSKLISKEEYEKLKNSLKGNSATRSGISSKSSSQTEKREKKTLSPGAIKAIVVVAAIFAIILISVFSSIKVKFGTMSPDTVNPNAGNGVISYDMVKQEYSKKYLSDVAVAISKKNCGYIVKYKSSMKTIKDQYERVATTQSGIPYPNAIGTPTDVRQESVDVTIYDVHTGKIIARKSFEGQLSYTLDSSTVYANKDAIARWIRDSIRNQK